jgi:outer membrane protein
MHNYLPTISINNSLKKQEYLHYDEIYNDKLNNQISLQINFLSLILEKYQKIKKLAN